MCVCMNECTRICTHQTPYYIHMHVMLYQTYIHTPLWRCNISQAVHIYICKKTSFHTHILSFIYSKYPQHTQQIFALCVIPQCNKAPWLTQKIIDIQTCKYARRHVHKAQDSMCARKKKTSTGKPMTHTHLVKASHHAYTHRMRQLLHPPFPQPVKPP